MHYEFRSYIFLPSGDQTLPDFSRDSQINSSLVYQRSSLKKKSHKQYWTNWSIPLTKASAVPQFFDIASIM